MATKPTHFQVLLGNLSVSLSSESFEITNMSNGIRVLFQIVINDVREINRQWMNGYEYGRYNSAKRVLFSFKNVSTLLIWWSERGRTGNKYDYSFFYKIEVILLY